MDRSLRFATLSLVALAGCHDFSLPPRATGIHDLTVEPAVVARGATVSVSFLAVGSGEPAVSLSGRLLEKASGPDAQGRYDFRYLVTGEEPEGVDLLVEAELPEGQGAQGKVRFDFTAPFLVSLAATPSRPAPGETLRLELLASEPLAALPAVSLGDQGFDCSPAGMLGASTGFSCRLLLGEGMAAGWLRADLTLDDLAGNRRELPGTDLGAAVDDGGAVALELNVEPARAREGAELRLEVRPTLPLDAAPAATVAGNPATLLSGPDGAGRYSFVYRVNGLELDGASPAVGTVQAQATGEVNGRQGSASATVALDFEPPRLLPVSASSPSLQAGESLQLQLEADEPVVDLLAWIEGVPLLCAPSDAAERWECTVSASGAEAEGQAVVVVQLADALGNVGQRSAAAGFAFDSVCTLDPQRVFVSGRPGASWTLIAEPGAFEPGARLSVEDDEGTALTAAEAVAAADGSLAPVELAMPELRRVFVLARSAAGHACARAEARPRYALHVGETAPGADPTTARALNAGTARPLPVFFDGQPTLDAAATSALATEDGLSFVQAAPVVEPPHWISIARVGNESWPDLPRIRPVAFVPGMGTVVWEGGNETRSWDGARWAYRAQAGGPLADGLFTLAYDQKRGALVMFGGFTQGGGGPYDDTWEMQGGVWSKRVVPLAPSARIRAAAAWDAVSARTVLFGGRRYSPDVEHDDTWTWDGASWRLEQPLVKPAVRSSHVMAYDPVRARTVLFGGLSGSTTLADTWEWTGTSWIARATSAGPAARAYHAAAYHPARGTVIVHGGVSGSSISTTHLSDAWEWDGLRWKPLVAANAAPKLAAHGMAFDERRGRLVAFGGESEIDVDSFDVWELTEEGLFPALLVTAVPFDLGRSPASLTVTIAARSSGGGAGEELAFAFWDSRQQRWVDACVREETAQDGVRHLVATLSGGEAAGVLDGRVRLLVVGRASSPQGAAELAVDDLELVFDW